MYIPGEVPVPISVREIGVTQCLKKKKKEGEIKLQQISTLVFQCPNFPVETLFVFISKLL